MYFCYTTFDFRLGRTELYVQTNAVYFKMTKYADVSNKIRRDSYGERDRPWTSSLKES